MQVRLGSLWTSTGVFIITVSVCWSGLAWAGDLDADGIEDAVDNCLEAENSDQRDTDRDGFGNACDADYDNDGAVGESDHTILRNGFGTTSEEAEFLAVGDHDGDGVVAGSDLAFHRSRVGLPIGPSGLSCADPSGATAPCVP